MKDSCERIPYSADLPTGEWLVGSPKAMDELVASVGSRALTKLDQRVTGSPLVSYLQQCGSTFGMPNETQKTQDDLAGTGVYVVKFP